MAKQTFFEFIDEGLSQASQRRCILEQHLLAMVRIIKSYSNFETYTFQDVGKECVKAMAMALCIIRRRDHG